MHNLSFNYIYSKPDSSMWFAQNALTLSKKAGYAKGEIRSMNDIGNTLNNSGNYSKALEILLEALQKAEELKDQNMQATTLGNISENYMGQGDYREAINYTFRSLAIDLANHDSLYLVIDYENLGDYYEKNNQADSALIYENQAYQLNLQVKNTDQMGSILNSLGNIQARLGNDDIALPLFRKSVVVDELVDNPTYASQSFFNIAKLYQRAGKQDSVFFYLKSSYAEGQKASYQQGMLNAAAMLVALYEKDSNDSTLKYLKLSVAIKDSLFSQGKVKQVQSLTFAEQLRQQEIEELKQTQAEDRKHNLQLAGIGAFIPLFFGIVLLLSRRKTKPRTIEFMGLLGLLLLFEFISLFIHPYIMKWTNNTPVFMLLILVAIAALLVPSHHKLQEWIKEKLAHKIKISPGAVSK